MSLVQQLHQELNQFRRNPANYAKKLEKWLTYFNGNILSLPGQTPLETEEGPEVFEECIKVLRQTGPLPLYTLNDDVSRSAQDHVEDLGPQGQTGHFGSDGTDCGDRMERYGEWQGGCGENIEYGAENPEEIVINLLVDDGVENRGHRQNLLRPDYTVIGIGHGEHADMDTMTVIVFTSGFVSNGSAPPAKKSPAKAPPARGKKQPVRYQDEEDDDDEDPRQLLGGLRGKLGAGRGKQQVVEESTATKVVTRNGRRMRITTTTKTMADGSQETEEMTEEIQV